MEISENLFFQLILKEVQNIATGTCILLDSKKPIVSNIITTVARVQFNMSTLFIYQTISGYSSVSHHLGQMDSNMIGKEVYCSNSAQQLPL